MIVFNSAFNRDTCREGVRQLAKRLPEGLPAQLFTKLDAAGVAGARISRRQLFSRTALPTDSPMEIVWNHRWEYDKGIELLAHIIEQVKQTGLRYRFHIVGQQFRHRPEAFEEIDRHLNEISAHFDMPRGNFGYIEDTDRYQALLTSCHVVLSTAKHDFQGSPYSRLAWPDARLLCRMLWPIRSTYPLHSATGPARIAGKRPLLRCHYSGISGAGWKMGHGAKLISAPTQAGTC